MKETMSPAGKEMSEEGPPCVECLLGLVIKASTSRAADPWFDSCLCAMGNFPGRVTQAT